MRRDNELERRLREWADEYRHAGENHGWQGKSWLSSMMKWGGRSPEGSGPERYQTAADEVEMAVAALEKQRDGFRPGRVLRAEYWMDNAAEEHKLQALRHAGLSMGRTTFYDELWIARVHVAAWLRIPASVELAVPG